ncbi:aminotransferase class I/II-fold pyridoxal phosphate-dependent enzyme [uncultured Kushneria sp.]|uniref:aminotransferase class I/II-fold pyridoxal phosphate-dependent enzyme n=1 Tax=uncultured Kushneria sp. TaxID=905033 RepID=UPI00260565FE|nr:aminotransferase class I/II-fold pyridoxal phosphate-dependent enzyme [uncultured Kushneria sp.]
MTVASDAFPMHGGRLSEISRRYGIDRCDWLDLSTGINPWSYPITPIDAKACQALPDQNQALHDATVRYYLGQSVETMTSRSWQSLTLLNIPGSQWAIEQLPHCLASGSVALPDIGYREHHWRWQKAGHQTLFYDADAPGTLMDSRFDTANLRAMVVINPNNPGGQHVARDVLRELAARLHQKGAVLIVDEAFADATPEQSLLPDIADNVIVLRSLGKFFGLAGLRLGTVVGKAQSDVMEHLSSLQGPWQVTSPTQQAGMEAFSDDTWQRQMRERLQRASQQQGQWLERQFRPHGDIIRWRQSALFNGFEMSLERASQWHEAFLPQGVLTRLWLIDEQRAILRFGLHDESAGAIHHLEQAMSAAQKLMEKRS